MEQLRLPDLSLTVDGIDVGGKSWLSYAGAYQLTISTVVPELDLEVHSSFLGHPDGDSAIAHLQLRPGERPAIASARRPGSELPVREGRRLCLYDHLVALCELVAEHTAAHVSVAVADQALELVDVA